MTMLTAEEARRLFYYNPDTGSLTWKVTKGSVALAGQSPKSLGAHGYPRVFVNGKHYRQHRVIWLIVTGKWPEQYIDHINGERSDNRWCNLRAATQSENMHNSRKPVTNTSGRKGAFWSKASQKWMSQIKVNGRMVYLGLFASVDEAGDAYANAARRYYGEYARVD